MTNPVATLLPGPRFGRDPKVADIFNSTPKPYSSPAATMARYINWW